MFTAHLAATTHLEPEWEVGSDHRTIRTTIAGAPKNRERGWKGVVVPLNRLDEWKGAVAASATPPRPTNTPEELDHAAEELTHWLTTAAKAVGRPKGSGRRRRAGWWTESCRQAKVTHTEAPDSATRKVFHNVVRKAKREYWAARVDEASQDAEAYKLATWAKPRAPETLGPAEVERQDSGKRCG